MRSRTAHSCDVTELRCRMKVKFIYNLYIGNGTQLLCSTNGPLLVFFLFQTNQKSIQILFSSVISKAINMIKSFTGYVQFKSMSSLKCSVIECALHVNGSICVNIMVDLFRHYTRYYQLYLFFETADTHNRTNV